jgi:hypothetical protein
LGWLVDEAELGLGDGEADGAVDADGGFLGFGDHDQGSRAAGERGRGGVPDQGAGEPAAAGGGMGLDVLVAGQPWFSGDQAQLRDQRAVEESAEPCSVALLGQCPLRG